MNEIQKIKHMKYIDEKKNINKMKIMGKYGVKLQILLKKILKLN